MALAFLRRHLFGFLLGAAVVLAAIILLMIIVPEAERSQHLVREIAAPDHVWYVDPATGLRRYIGSEADAAAVIAATAQRIPEAELKRIPKGAFGSLSAGSGTAERWRGRFLSGPDGEVWFVHDASRWRTKVPLGSGGVVPFLIARSRELGRGELRDIPVAADSPEWLVVPEGYEADIIAGPLSHPRVLGWDPAGRLVVSEYLERGRITAYDRKADGGFAPNVIVDGRSRGLSNLFNAHGFAFLGGRLYVASEHVLESWAYDAASGRVQGESRLELELPPGSDQFAGQGHRTRTLVAGTDGKLYLSIGSSCDSCATLDRDEYAVIKRLDPAGGKTETVATGLRNAVFFTEDSARGLWWANEMGRDDLGEELPPDELNVIRTGKDYGWPHCWGDRQPAPGAPDPAACAATEPPVYHYLAHSAPLGLRIVPASFNPAWEGDLLTAFHGSTLRKNTVAGYAIARVDLDASGRPLGQEDVITGFLKGMNVPAGRPVDLLFGPDGTLYVTDDHAGVIHRIRKKE